MVLRSKHLLRHVLINQHRLQNCLQQQTRLCSNDRAQPNVDDSQSIRSVNAATHRYLPDPKPIEHGPENGRLFTASELRVRLSSPSQLIPKPDVEDLVYGKFFTDHMLKISWHRSLGGWQKPDIIPIETIPLHPAAKVLQYAVELFEGMKAYRGVDGRIRIFRPNMNMARMNVTATRSGLPTFEGNELIKCLKRLVSIDQEWVPHKIGTSLYIRPTMIGIDPALGLAISESALLYAVLSPVGDYFQVGTKSSAVSLLADPQYIRAWPGGCGDRKMGSNYAPTLHVQRVATKKGLQQVLWLHGEDHQLTEVGSMNIFIYFINDKGEKELRTPPLNGLILPGITRDSILQLVMHWGTCKVTEAPMTMPEIVQLVKQERLLEMFGSGTACVVSPIDRIQFMGEDVLIPTMEHQNPIFNAIKTELADIHYGRKAHPWGVCID